MRPLPQVIEEEKVDYALLDATFYSPDELPDRDVSKISTRWSPTPWTCWSRW